MSLRAAGGERALLELATAFDSQGYDVDLVVVKPNGHYLEQIQDKLRIVSLGKVRIIATFPAFIRIILTFPAFMRYLKRETPYAVIATDDLTHLSLLIAKLISHTRFKAFLRIGNVFSILQKNYTRSKYLLVPFPSKLLYKKADGYIAVSEGVAEDAAKTFNIPRERIPVIFTPKNISLLRTRSRQLPEHPWFKDGSDPLIVFVGRLRKQKDIPTLLRAFQIVRQSQNTRLIICGIGREEQRLKEIATDLRITDNISFVGFVENPYAYMGHADIYVLSSLWEGLPNSLIEALVCGIAVIAADCHAGPRELLAPSSNPKKRITSGVEYAEFGVLFPVGGVHELASALSELLQNQSLRKKYKQKSLQRGNDFDFDKSFLEFEKIITQDV